LSRSTLLKTLRVEETSLNACLAEARHGRVILTRNGHPVALVVSVDGLDEEQIRLGSSPEFWKLMEESRAQKTIGREELERRLGRTP
jgi:antitoxin (DNA-binding transcriptional repressor) of toxin-antitoxin stability system